MLSFFRALHLIEDKNLYLNIQGLKNDFVKVEKIKIDYFLKLIIYMIVIYLVLFTLFAVEKLFKLPIQNVNKKIFEFIRMIRTYEFEINLQFKLLSLTSLFISVLFNGFLE